MKIYDLNVLGEMIQKMNVLELRCFARDMGVYAPTKKKRDQIIEEIYLINSGELAPSKQSTRGRPVISHNYEFSEVDNISTDTLNEYDLDNAEACFGVVTIDENGVGNISTEIIKSKSYDMSFSPEEVKSYELREGDYIKYVRSPLRRNGEFRIYKIVAVNDQPFSKLKDRGVFDEIFPIMPRGNISMESNKLINNHTFPIKYGQRSIICCDSKTNRIDILIEYLSKVEKKDNTKIIVLLANESPELMSGLGDYFNCETFSTTSLLGKGNLINDTLLVLQHAKRVVEQGDNVIFFISSLNEIIKTIMVNNKDKDKDNARYMIIDFIKSIFYNAKCSKMSFEGSLTIMGMLGLGGINDKELCDSLLSEIPNHILTFEGNVLNPSLSSSSSID